MAKIGWKVINGYGPYAYLQQSVRRGDKVTSDHIQYLGRLGATSNIGSGVLLPGYRVEAPFRVDLPSGEAVGIPLVPPYVAIQLKPSSQRVMFRALAGEALADFVYSGTPLTFESDPPKRERVFKKRAIDLDIVGSVFDWADADYYSRMVEGEHRRMAIGPARGRLITLVYTERGNNVRLITSYPAKGRLLRHYAQRRGLSAG